ncbi:MAG: alpha/beta hydrolase [Acidimicrobiales bacterium]
MPFIDVDGLQMYYEMHGDPEAPPVLMISGTGNDLRWSQPDRNPINKAGYVCHFDQRGLGQTDKPDGPYTMAQYADDAAGLAAALGWSRCHVVGTSFGGMVALNLVQRHPDLVDRLVLNCTSPGGDHASFPLHTLTDLPPDELLDRRMRLTDGRYDPDADEPLPGIPQWSTTPCWHEAPTRRPVRRPPEPPPARGPGRPRRQRSPARHRLADPRVRRALRPHRSTVQRQSWPTTFPARSSESSRVATCS